MSRDAHRLLTRDECETLGRRILALTPASRAQVSFDSMVIIRTSFARGDAYRASETETVSVTLAAEFGGRRSVVSTNRLDDEGLEALITDAEASAAEHRSPDPLGLVGPQYYPEGPRIFFDTVVDAMAPAAQGALFRAVIAGTRGTDLVGAGDLVFFARARAALDTAGLSAYEQSSYGELSLTVRTPDGSGSGWAWSGFEDWSRVDVDEVVTRAVSLARRSVHPVAVEPGRYTVILEPAAVAALIAPVARYWSAQAADEGRTVFSRDPEGNKIGLQMLDRRLGMVSDPWDPLNPGSTITRFWLPIPGPVTWFERGVLRNLEYSPAYAHYTGREPIVAPYGVRLTADGPPQALEEMIASTKRGIWVNRLSHVSTMNQRTLLLTGATRDGTFLIENGKITKSIKNFRFTDSPFFALNKLEAFGEPVRASSSIVAPRLKVRDFNFSSLSDAV